LSEYGSIAHSPVLVCSVPKPWALDHTLQQFNAHKWFILQITKQAADSYCSERWLPVCELAAQWEGEDEQPAPLHHEIDLIGAQPPTAYLSLDLAPKGKTAVGKIEGMKWK